MEVEQTDGQCHEEGSTGIDTENAGIGERIAGGHLDQRHRRRRTLRRTISPAGFVAAGSRG